MLSRREMIALSVAALPGGLHPRLAWALTDEDPTKVFTSELKPTDYRLGEPKNLNDYFPFVVPKTKEAWEARRKQLREQLLVANGLWPLPEKTPLNAVVHGKIDRDGYTIEKVYFASTPGHYVCGNLYRPAGTNRRRSPVTSRRALRARPLGKRPAPRRGREDRARRAWTRAASQTWTAAGTSCRRFPATLAKLGFVVFQYDMVGVRRQHRDPARREGFTDVAGRTAASECDGPADLEQHPRARLPRRSAGRGCEEARHDRRQRRRHADLHARRASTTASRARSPR